MAWLDLPVEQALDEILFSSGIGFAVLQLLVGIVSFAAGLTLRLAIALLAIMGVAGSRGWLSLPRLGQRLRTDLFAIFRTASAKWIGVCIIFFAGMEALLATAPLTGSDAMHYHFTAPLLELGKPEHPIFWLTNSFFLGLGHELIGLGLALGGDKLALLAIFLGGCLTAAALLQIARKLMPAEWALAAVLAFLMAPMVFWQIGTAGSPDIWIGFYVLLATLALNHIFGPASHRWILLAGVFSGAAAGIKYTGWIIPVVIAVCVLRISRSILWAALGSIAAVIAGIFPLLRNYWWTGDPFFPFLGRWLGRVPANPSALKLVQASVHSNAFSRLPLGILHYLTAMALRGSEYGFGNYFGPIVLAFLPLLFFCDWRKRLVWVGAALWFSLLFTNALTTQMARFLLPAFPLALILVFSGAAGAARRAGNGVRLGCAATLALFGVFCFAANALYARDFLPVSLGLEHRQAFLDRMAPDYGAAKFINEEMAGRQGKALVFNRHLFYLRVPYQEGNPDASWETNPDRLTDPAALLQYLKEADIGWVVKFDGYPAGMSGVFEECEKLGKLVPEAQGEVKEFAGNSRTLNNRRLVPIVLMRVAN
ncbi:MAG: hypothetical protein LAO19_07295 [Acidobacteriia bacterium]|nr:hypothetical protein [Terriglobia bacterium]